MVDHQPRAALVEHRLEFRIAARKRRDTGKRPDASDHAFAHHRAVEDRARIFLVGQAAGDHRRLGGMETTDGTAGDGQEQQRPDRQPFGIGRQEVMFMMAMEVGEHIADLGQVGGFQQQRQGHQRGHHYHQQAEQRIQPGDDLVDRQQGGQEVVEQDDQYPYRVAAQEGTVEYRQVAQQSGRTHDEDHADEEQQHAGKYQHEALEDNVVIVTGDFRQALAVFLEAHYPREVVMHGTADDVADHDPDQRDGAVEGAEDGAEDGLDAGDIQELDQEGTAGAQRYVVHPIVETLLGRDIGGIYPGLLFHEGTVEAVTKQQDGKAEEE